MIICEIAAILEKFENIAEEIGIRIIQEKGNFNGGYCLLEAERIIVLNKHKPIEQRIDALAKAFSQIDTSKVYLKPILKILIASSTFQLGVSHRSKSTFWTLTF